MIISFLLYHAYKISSVLYHCVFYFHINLFSLHFFPNAIERNSTSLIKHLEPTSIPLALEETSKCIFKEFKINNFAY